jgi:hypothetical protein
MPLTRVGFFREVRELLGEDGSELPSLRAAVRPEGYPDTDRILSYLRGGVCLWACGGVMPDVLNPLPHVMTSPDYLTDGVWLWPGELEHYVAHHHIELPVEFVGHRRANGWVVPSLSPERTRALCDEVARAWPA